MMNIMFYPKVLYYAIKQIIIIFLLPVILLFNKFCNGYFTNLIKLLAVNGGPFFIKAIQWGTQNEELSYLLCINSIKNIQYYCDLKDEKYAKKMADKLDLRYFEYVGAGSIAQVYKCKIFTLTGNKVEDKICAVKILHKDIKEILTTNIFYGKIFFFFVKKYNLIPLLKSYDTDTIFAEHLRQYDLIAEANNTILLRNNNKIDNVHFANIYYKDETMIVEDFFDGYKYDEFIKKYPEYTIEAKKIQMTAFLNMIFCQNIIYGDCHDGNVLYNIVDEKVHAYLIDCGIIHEIKDEFKDILYQMFMGYNTRNADMQVKLYEKYNLMDKIDTTELKDLLLDAMNENRKKNNFPLYVKRILEINRRYKLCGHYLFDILCVNLLLIMNDKKSLLFDTIKTVLKEKKHIELCDELNKYQFSLF